MLAAAAVPQLKRTGKQGYVFILTDFNFLFRIPDINQCVNSYFEIAFLKRINLIKVLFIGFVKFEIEAMVRHFLRSILCLA